MDLLSSFAFAFSTIPGPAELDKYYPLYGNEATCNAQGFLVQVGLGAPLYNAAMGIFYVLTIRFNVSNDFLKRKFIPVAHILIWGFMLSSAIAGLVLDLFGFDGALGCWIDTKNHPTEFIWMGVVHSGLSFVVILLSMIYL